MGNIIFGMLATPNTHKKFIKDINSFKYDIEGEKFKGTQAPFVSELKFYDIRIPEEIEHEVIRDLRLFGNIYGHTCDNWKYKITMWLYKTIIRLFTPFKPIKPVSGEPKFQFDKYCWKYILPVGILKRKKMKVQIGKDREIL